MADTEVDTKDAPAAELKSFASTSSVDLEARTVRHFITTTDVDEVGDVVLPRGCDLSRFKKSGTVFDVHDYSTTKIVGKNVSLTMRDNGIEAVTRFTPRPPPDLLPTTEEWWPDVVLWMYATGDLKGWSIGLSVLDARAPTKADREKWGDAVKRVITRWRLMEYSTTGLPMNGDALTLSLSKGIISPRLAEVLKSGRAPTRDELPELEATKSADDPDPDTTESMPACPVCKDDGDMQPDGDEKETLAYRCAKCGTRMVRNGAGNWDSEPAGGDRPNKVLLVPESAAGPDAAPVLIGIPPGPTPSAATLLIGVPPAPPETPDKLLIEVPAATPEAPPEPPESLLLGIPPATPEAPPAGLLIGVAPPEPQQVLIEVPPEPQQRLIELPTPAPEAPEPEPQKLLIELQDAPPEPPPAPPEKLLIELAAESGPQKVLIELPQPEAAPLRTVMIFLPAPVETEAKAVAPDFGRVVAASVAMGLAKARGRLFA